MSVTTFIGILSKARAHILRLTSARLHDLVASDWAARAVLRYWRLRNHVRRTLGVLLLRARRPSVNFVGHVLVLGLGFVLVLPSVGGRSAPTRTVSAGSSAVGSCLGGAGKAGTSASQPVRWKDAGAGDGAVSR